MFDSGIFASAVIDDVIAESDIAIDIPKSMYVKWLNDTVRLLYTDIIKEQGELEIPNITTPKTYVDIEEVNVPNDEEKLRFEDIYTVYFKYVNQNSETRTRQLIRSTNSSGVIFPDTFYDNKGDLGLNLDFPDGTDFTLRIMYFIKPKDVYMDGTSITGKVMLPYEFIDLIKAKLRGEAYKIANEDNLSAKWLNDYNSLLEAFKVWISQRNQTLGM